MAYQVLARKWRPRSFAEMAGQEHVLRALINALDQQRLHQAFLFTGTRGVGKTTIARILAKALNCEVGVSSTPCGKCTACTEIDEGRFIDLIEVDAASRTKVEDTRELLDNVQYTPTRARYKVYLIDEVHMLSTHSFNALLKTLEEPPPHVKFLLATTDPQKLPATILSRCLQFNLKRMPPDLIEGRLAKILESESIQHDRESLKYLAKAADGSMRDGLSLLDQAIAFCHESLNAKDISMMLGLVSRQPIIELLTALQQQDAKALLDCVAEIDQSVVDYHAVLDELITILQSIALHQCLSDNDESEDAELNTLAESIGIEDVQLFYQIALSGKRDLDLSPDIRRGFEMIMLRMLAFRPANGFDTVTTTNRSVSSDSVETSQTSSKQASRDTAAESSVSGSTGLNWQKIYESLELKGMVAELAANCTIRSYDEKLLTLVVADKHAQILNDTLEKRLVEAVNAVLEKPLTIKIEVGELPHETPAGNAARLQDEKLSAAVQSMQQNTTVQELKDRFDARLDEDSIQPLN